MKTNYQLLVCALTFAAPCVAVAQVPDPAPVTGKVLLLDNERVLDGDIERVGDRYRVQRKIGETWVPAEKALRLCKDMEDAYAYLRGRANLNDADERLRLANWCRQNGMREQALAELKAAVALRPDHAMSRRLLESMQRTTALVKPVENTAPREEVEPTTLPPVELTASALGLFCTKVQPILMNTCASCHATGRGGSFKLIRAYEAGSLARKTTQQNLTAVLAQLDPEQPLNSKFLIRAVSAHGNDVSKAPLAGRDSPPYRALEEWVRLTVTNNPHLQERSAVQPAAFSSMETKVQPAQKAETTSKPTTAPSTPADARPMTPTKEEASNDPFDPNSFNREHHPKKQEQPAETPKPKS